MPGKIRKRFNVLTSENDHAARAFSEYVPKKYRDTAQYIDVLQWNIEWFGAGKSQAKDRLRFDRGTHLRTVHRICEFFMIPTAADHLT